LEIVAGSGCFIEKRMARQSAHGFLTKGFRYGTTQASEARPQAKIEIEL
jgi:hypothetical protein